MSPEEKKRLVLEFYTEVGRDGDYSKFVRYVSPAYVDHNAPAAGRGPDIVRRHLTSLQTTFPDFTLEVRQIFCDGDFVISRVVGQGTHLGAWMGIAPSGRTIQVKGINIDRLHAGQIIEHWGEADTLGMLIQMGVQPFLDLGETI
jgi:predicted ester cyclase